MGGGGGGGGGYVIGSNVRGCGGNGGWYRSNEIYYPGQDGVGAGGGGGGEYTQTSDSNNAKHVSGGPGKGGPLGGGNAGQDGGPGSGVVIVTW